MPELSGRNLGSVSRPNQRLPVRSRRQFSILISGAFLAIINATGAIDAGIGALLKKLSGKKLIAILMFIFAMMGTVYGSCEELPAYALVLIPLCVTAGYDVVTGIMVLFGGAHRKYGFCRQSVCYRRSRGCHR